MIGAGNPTLTPDIFKASADGRRLEGGKSVMTIQGAVNASMILGAVCAASAIGGWTILSNNPGMVMPMFLGGAIGGLILSLLIFLKPKTAPFAAPVYAVLQGLFIGGISLLYAKISEGTKLGGSTGSGIVLNAGVLTFGVLFGMLFLYKTGIIKATGKFIAGVMAATAGVGMLFITVLVMNMFGGNTSWFYSGWIAIGISAAVVVIAAMNLIINFHVIEEGANAGAPKYMEWYAAFGLLVTVIWLYISMLRLLSMLNSRK